MTSARDELIKAGLLKTSRRRARPTPLEMIKFECRECGLAFSSPYTLHMHKILEQHGKSKT